MSDSMYWSSHDILTRNAMFNFVVGGRGTGKTYDAKYTRIQHYIKTGWKFIYLRRYKTEFDDKGSFFKDVGERFPDWEFRVQGMHGDMRRKSDKEKNPNKWDTVVYFITLSNAITKKSVPYPDIDYIVYDEFILDKGCLHYLPNEVKAFLDFYNTVDRFEDRVKVLLLANAVTITNPYFMFYRLRPRKGQRFVSACDGYICVESVQSQAFQKHVDNTRFGKMIKGTPYYNYAVGNEYHDDNDLFIEKKPCNAKYAYGLRFDGKQCGVWVDYSTLIYYISRKVPPDGKPFVLTRDDMEPDMLMIDKTSGILKSLKRLYMNGAVRFDSVQTRAFFDDVITYLNVR